MRLNGVPYQPKQTTLLRLFSRISLIDDNTLYTKRRGDSWYAEQGPEFIQEGRFRYLARLDQSKDLEDAVHNPVYERIEISDIHEPYFIVVEAQKGRSVVRVREGSPRRGKVLARHVLPENDSEGLESVVRSYINEYA